MGELHIIQDSRQQQGKHEHKERWFDEFRVSFHRSKCIVGDYTLPPEISIDTKKDIYELAQDIDRDHERFKREMILARDIGCQLYVLVENMVGVTDFQTLAEWNEPLDHLNMRKRKSGNYNARQINGSRLAKACMTMESRYGVRFMFCHPSESAQAIVYLLTGGDSDA